MKKPIDIKFDKFDDFTKMPFGKYKGITLANIPDDYLKWFYERNYGRKQYGDNQLLMEYIEENKDTIFK